MPATPIQPELPSSAPADLGSLARVAMAGIAGVIATKGATLLAAHGIITDGSTADVVSWLTAFIVAAAAAIWAKMKNIHVGNQLVAAGATGNPNADPKAPETIAAVQKAIADPASPITAKAA